MNDWKEIEFANLLENESISYGVVQPGPHIENDGVPIIRVQNIRNGKIKADDIKKIAKKIEESYLRTRLKGGELLITVVGSVGECAIVNTEFAGWNVARAVSVARIKDEYDKNFIRYCFSTDDIKFQMYGNTNDTVQPTLNLKELKSLKLKLPPLLEQKSITEVLTSLDDKIDLLHYQNKTLEAMAETLFREWFVERAEEAWEEVKVGDFVKTNIKSINKEYQYSNIKYLDTGSLTNGKIESLQELEINNAPSRARRLVKHNDILISTVRPNHRHFGIVKKPLDNLVVSTGFCVISCDEIDPHFIYVLLTTNDMTEYLHSIAEGSTSTYPSLKPSDIEAISFLMPPVDKLNQFAEFALDNWNKIDYNQTQIQTLEKLRDTLLPKLMSGAAKVVEND